MRQIRINVRRCLECQYHKGFQPVNDHTSYCSLSPGHTITDPFIIQPWCELPNVEEVIH